MNSNSNEELSLEEPASRRPLRSRDTAWAKYAAGKLAARNISPNQVSLFSIAAAALAGCCLVLTRAVPGNGANVLFVLAAGFVQLRLLCNLLDGMLAIEAGKQSKSGGLYNELPDRIADILILFAFALTVVPSEISFFPNPAPYLGACTVTLALLTAYVRALGASLTGEQDFIGPMAKQHRMAAVTVTCLIVAFFVNAESERLVLLAGNIVILFGTALTFFRRSQRLLKKLEAE